jgi:hypothetical protein
MTDASLDALWDELLLDALASDGPIRDADVKNAVKHYRPRIETESRRLTVEWAGGEIQANRTQGVKWEPPIGPNNERWYAEGYDRGLRDALTILEEMPDD